MQQVAEDSVVVVVDVRAIGQDAVRLDFSDKTSHTFYSGWLRDSCRCDDCFPLSISNRRVRDYDAECAAYLGCRPFLEEKDGLPVLIIEWCDGHKSTYDSPWLRVWADVGQGSPGASTVQRAPWGGELEVPVFDAKAVESDASELERFLMTIYRHPGVAVLKGLETAESGSGMQSGMSRFVTEKIGVLHNAMAGEPVWEISTQGGLDNQSLDYSRRPLNKHTDQSHYNTVPPIGWFMQVAAGSGGTAVTDTLRCWKMLTPREKEVLSSMKGIFGNRRIFGVTNKDSACVVPFVELDDHGELYFVRHSTSKFGPFLNSASSSNISEQMAVWRRWNALIQDHAHEVVVHLTKGDVLCLNNHRVMHGRAVVTGDRVVHGCYATQTVVENRIRLLMQAKLPSHCEHLALMLPMPNLVAFHEKRFGWHKGKNVSADSNGATKSITANVNRDNDKGKVLVAVEKVEADSGLLVTFDDSASFQFSASWLTDALPARFGTDLFREHGGLPCDAVLDSHVASCVIQDGGANVRIEWELSGTSDTKLEGNTVPAVWLRALAPLVAAPLNATARTETARQVERMNGPLGADGSCGLGRAETNAKPWLAHELEVPIFEYAQLESDEATQERFLESIMDPGVLKIRGAPVPEDGGVDGDLLTKIVTKLVGKPVQHPSRANCVWSINMELGEEKLGSSDYDFGNPLAMHTDQSFRYDTSFIIWMHQTEGRSESMIGDGLAISERLRSTDPRAWELLTSVPVTWGYRHRIYGHKGELISLENGNASYRLLEHERHVHWPALMVHPDGSLKTIRLGESKRSMQNMPPGKFEEWYTAYNKFLELSQSDEFVRLYDFDEGDMLVINNHRLIHGRAKIKTPTRILTGTYNTEEQVRNRYRLLLIRRLTAMHGLEEQWFLRLPTPALENMLNLTT